MRIQIKVHTVWCGIAAVVSGTNAATQESAFFSFPAFLQTYDILPFSAWTFLRERESEWERREVTAGRKRIRNVNARNKGILLAESGHKSRFEKKIFSVDSESKHKVFKGCKKRKKGSAPTQEEYIDKHHTTREYISWGTCTAYYLKIFFVV